MASQRQPVWVLRALPLDPATGAVVPVWLNTLTRPVVLTEPNIDNWLQFGGSLLPDPDRVTMGTFGNIGTQLFALGLRFRTTISPEDAIISTRGKRLSGTGNFTTGCGYGLGVTTDGSVIGAVGDAFSTDQVKSSVVPYNDGNWHTLVLIRYLSSVLPNIITVALYYDGTLVDSIPSSDLDASCNPNATFQLGLGESSVNPFEGDVERVCFFDGAAGPGLNDSSAPTIVHALLNTTPMADAVETAPDSLTGAWAMNEGTGRSTFNLANILGTPRGELFNDVTWGISSIPQGSLRGLLSSPFSVRASVVSGNAILPRGLPQFGDIVYGNPNGQLDDHLDYSWYRRIVEVRKGFDDEAFEDMPRIWKGEAKDPRGDRDTITLPLRGVEDTFDVPLQPPEKHYQPGFEPYFIGDGVDNQISFTNVLNRGTINFTMGCAFRTTVGSQGAGLYIKKEGVLASQAGYGLSLGAGGTIRLDLSDGTNGFNINLVPPGGYDAGVRIAVIGRVIQTNNIAHLYWNIDGAGWVEAGTVDITGLGNIDNTNNLYIGRRGSGAFFNGEVERVAQIFGADNSNLAAMQNALDERYAEDVDASGFSHYVPLTENFGTAANDLSPNNFHGTITGDDDPDTFWSGLRNGTRDIEGRPWPAYYGEVPHAKLVLLDPVKQIWHANDRQSPGVISVVREFYHGGLNDITQSGLSGGGNDVFITQPPAGTWYWDRDPELGLLIRGNLNVTDQDGEFTADIALDSGDGKEATQILFELQERLDPDLVDLSIISSPPFSTFTADQTVGIGWLDEITIGEAITQLVQSWGYSWTVNPRLLQPTDGKIRISLFQPRDVSAETPDAVLRIDPDDNVSDIEQFGMEIDERPNVYERARARFSRIYGHQPMGETLPGAEFRMRELLANEWREVEVTADTLGYRGNDLATFLADQVLEFDMAVNHVPRTPGLTFGGPSRPHAEAEALRRLALWSQRPRLVTVELSGYLFEFWLGDVIEVIGPRFGHESGKKYIVVSVDDDADNSGSRLTLWGGFDSV